MNELDILAWISTAIAILLASLLGLNLAYSGRRMNRPPLLMKPVGDLAVLGLALPGLVTLFLVVYLIVTSSNWPALAIATGLAILAAPPLHQHLGAFLRNNLIGAALLSMLCLVSTLCLATVRWSL
ncbi:hypothetical protein [Fodinicurvata fenggangensis]|uniref:hypothetical protein n=1 Tax=Fodinicurvata fenggangensis TaxID=1121830 RepID=UPI00047C6F30|nr:hypothetical protein [Fodinicurvata fenggangensis]